MIGSSVPKPAAAKPAASPADMTRAALIRAALGLFGKQGFDGTSTREIAAAAKANIGSIAYHFGSKEGLRTAVADYITDLIQTVASQAKFLSANIKSRQHLLETFLTLDATLTSFQPGAYKLQYVLHDRAANKDVTFEVPITLLPGEAGSAASSAPGSEQASGSSAAQ